MNITPHIPTLPVGTAVNPQTDSLRRENNIRQVIAQPEAASKGAAEKGVASDRERGRAPNQAGESFDFAELQKQAEEKNSVINGDEQARQQSSEQQPEQQAEQQGEASNEQGDDTSAQTRIQEFEEKQQIDKLEQRDREVRSHELAHASVGGAATGAPNYTYQVGPDGKKYAVGGEVSVDLSVVKDNPRATIAKMKRVYAAALAPVSPSAQDNRVASAAARMILEAQSQLADIRLNDADVSSGGSNFSRKTDVFSGLVGDTADNAESRSFDAQIERTLQAQEAVSPSRTKDVADRALRVEGYYLTITQAYEKPASSNFQLTA